jgi:uncharacterized membrane protein (Fun14 family)
MVDTVTNLIPYGGLPLLGGGLVGFVLGWLCRKLLKLAIIGLGLIFALLAYLQYQKWIKVDWTVAQNETSRFLEHSSQKLMSVVNETSMELSKHNYNHLDIAYPVFGVIGFAPGFLLGLARG